MPEKDAERDRDRGIKIKMTPTQRIENFWYHYKWHTVVALFLIAVIIICSVQCGTKEKYDIYISYAGSREVKMTAADGDKSEYEELLTSLRAVAPDENGDGRTSVSLRTLWLLTQAEQTALAEKLREEGKGEEINYTLLRENSEVYQNSILLGDYYLWFMSESLYLENREQGGSPLFADLREYVGGAEVTYLDSSAVYLSSTAFGRLPGLSSMPEGTVICLRRRSESPFGGNKKTAEGYYRASEDTLRAIFSYS